MLARVRDGSSAGNTLRAEKKLTLGRFRAANMSWSSATGTNTALRTYWGARPALPVDGHGVPGDRGLRPTRGASSTSFSLVTP